MDQKQILELFNKIEVEFPSWIFNTINWLHISHINSILLTAILNKNEVVEDFLPRTFVIEVSTTSPIYTVYTIEKRKKENSTIFSRLVYEAPTISSIFSKKEQEISLFLTSIITEKEIEYQLIPLNKAIEKTLHFSSIFLPYANPIME